MKGLWRNYRIEEVASPHAWRRDPRLVWEFYSIRRRVAAEAKPNPAHFALAKLEERLGDSLFLCTQNVEQLARAGWLQARRPASCSRAAAIRAAANRSPIQAVFFMENLYFAKEQLAKGIYATALPPTRALAQVAVADIGKLKLSIALKRQELKFIQARLRSR